MSAPNILTTGLRVRLFSLVFLVRAVMVLDSALCLAANKPPPPPTLVTPTNGATDIDPTSAALTWKLNPDPDGERIISYLLIREHGQPWKLDAPGDLGDATNYQPSTLRNGVRYDWTVAAVDWGEHSDVWYRWSVVRSFTTKGLPPVITSQPRGQSVAVGGSVTFTVVAEGTPPLSYQWRKDGKNLPGATDPTLNLKTVSQGDSGTYSVLVSNMGEGVTSSNAVLTVLLPPDITAQPQNQAVLTGGNVTFSVTATGDAPLSYQWRKDGVNISGATATSYLITDVQANQAGSYSVVVSNAGGSAPSASALLTVTPKPSAKVVTSALRILSGHTGGINNVGFAPDSSRILTGSSDTTAILWNAETGDLVKQLDRMNGNVTAAVFLPSGERILTVSSSGKFVLWDKAGSFLIETDFGEGIYSAAYSPDGQTLLVGTGSLTFLLGLRPAVYVYPAAGGSASLVVGQEALTGFYVSVAYSPTEDKILSGEIGGGITPFGGKCMLWDAKTGKELFTFVSTLDSGEVPAVAFSPDGKRALTSDVTEADLWNVNTGVLIRKFSGHTGSVKSVAFSPNGRWLATGSSDKTVRVWDSETGDTVAILQGHTDEVNAVSFSPDGLKILSGSSDKTARLWDATFTQPAPIRLTSDGDSEILFQDDGGYLAVWSMQNLNLKTASFLDPKSVDTPGDRAVGTGDFNNDGNADLLFQKADGSFVVWFMDGALKKISEGPLSPKSPSDIGWRGVATADIDNDGQTDLILQHTDGRVALWIMNGATRRSETIFGTSDRNWRVAAVGDLDGDGKKDLIFEHSTGELGMWKMDGTNLVKTSLLGASNPSSGWHIVGAADRNADGKTDLLWQHDNGDLGVWFMDGTKMTSAQVLSPSTPGGTWRTIGVGAAREVRIVLLLHGMNSAPNTWDDFMRDSNLRYFAIQTPVAPEISQGKVTDNESPTPDRKGVLYYRLRFGAFDANPGRTGVQGVRSSTRRTNGDAFTYTGGDFSEMFGPNSLAQEIRDAIEYLGERYGNAEILLVAHSRGGLAARAFLETADYTSERRAVVGLLTVGTPHHGSPFGRVYTYLNEHPVPDKSSTDSTDREVRNDWFLVRDLIDLPFGHDTDVRRPTIGDLAPGSSALKTLINSIDSVPPTIAYGVVRYTNTIFGLLYDGVLGKVDVFRGSKSIGNLFVAEIFSGTASNYICQGTAISSLAGDGIVPAASQTFSVTGINVIDHAHGGNVLHTEEPGQQVDIRAAMEDLAAWWRQLQRSKNALPAQCGTRLPLAQSHLARE